MTARVVLTTNRTLSVDPVGYESEAILLSFEDRGFTEFCALIPLDRIRAVIASLELVAEQARP